MMHLGLCKLKEILFSIGTSNPCENDVAVSIQAFICICWAEFFGYGTNRTGFEKIWAFKFFEKTSWEN